MLPPLPEAAEYPTGYTSLDAVYQPAGAAKPVHTILLLLPHRQFIAAHQGDIVLDAGEVGVPKLLPDESYVPALAAKLLTRRSTKS